MGFTEYRIALFAAYVAVIVWKYSRHTEGDLWLYLIGFFGLRFVLWLAEQGYWRWSERRAVRAMRSLDPARQRALISKMWLSIDRKFYHKRLAAEGAPERAGAVERFPFGATDLRENAMLFWLTAFSNSAVLVVLFVFRALPRWSAWLLWAVAIGLMLLLAWLRRRERHLRTVLEISPFAISEEAEDGTRRTIQWSEPLILWNRPRLGRAQLHVAGRADYIAIDYSRLAFERIANLVIDHGGFPREVGSAA